MKKKYIIPGLLAAVAAVGLTSCGEDQQPQSTLSDLEVTGYTQEFKVGDTFSLGNLKVEAKYSDDKVVDITKEKELKIKAPNSLSTPGTYAVIVSYGGLSEAYQITVKDDTSSKPDTPVVTLKDLIVSGAKNSFIVGEAFATEGLKVEAKYSDDKVEDVTSKAEIAGPESISTPGTYAVIVSYGGLSAAYQITVKDNSSTAEPITLENLIVSGAKDSFIVGEAFATTGLKVEAEYSDDHKVDVTNDIKIIAPESLSTPGTYAVIITYGGLSTSYKVTVSPEIISVADAVALGVENASKINGGVVTLVSGTEQQSGTYTLTESHNAYMLGENSLEVKEYSGYLELYRNIYHYFLASNDKLYGVREYYDEDAKKYVLESMDTSALGADILEGVALSVSSSENVYGSAAYVKALYDLASKNGNGDFKETVEAGTYTFEAGMYDEAFASYRKTIVSFELSEENTFKNIEVLLTSWDDPEDYKKDETTNHYSLTDKASRLGAMYQQYIFDETLGARDYETQYVEENLISESFTLKDSNGADVADGATINAELGKGATLAYSSTNQLISPIVDKPVISCESNNVYVLYSDPTQDGPIFAGSVDATVEGKLTFTDWDYKQTVFTILANGDLKDALDHTYVKQNKDNQSVYDTYTYTAEDGTYIKFNYTDDPYMDSTLAYSGDGKIHISAYTSGTCTIKIETILSETTLTVNVPYMNPDSMSAKEFIPNEDNPNQATYASEESTSMRSLVNDSLYFVGVPKYQYSAANASPTEFKAEIVSDNKADATLELVDCSYQDGKIKAYQFTSAKTGTYEVKITSTIVGCEEVTTTITIEVVDVSNVQLTDVVKGYYDGYSNYLQSFDIHFEPTSSDALEGVAYVSFETFDCDNNKYATTYNYVIDADAKTVTLTENGEEKAAALTVNLNKFMEMSLSLQYGMSQYPISLVSCEAPDLSTYYADYKNALNEDTISISADGITASLGGQAYTATSTVVVGNTAFVDFGTVSLVLELGYGTVTDSTYGAFNKVVHEDPLAPYYGTYKDANEQSTLTISADGITYDGYDYKLKSLDANTLVIEDLIDPTIISTFEIQSEGLYDSNNGVLLIKQVEANPLEKYYGTYTDANGQSTLTISADGITYDGYDYKLKSLDANTLVIEDLIDPTYICTFDIRSDGLYDSNNGVLLIKQEAVDPLAAYYGSYEFVDPNDPSFVATIIIDETGLHYSEGGPEKAGTLTFENGIITYTFEDSFYLPLQLTPTIDGSICVKLTDSGMGWEYLRK